jgi:hypothetical protein
LWKSFNLKSGVAGEACPATESGMQLMAAELQRSLSNAATVEISDESALTE